VRLLPPIANLARWNRWRGQIKGIVVSLTPIERPRLYRYEYKLLVPEKLSAKPLTRLMTRPRPRHDPTMQDCPATICSCNEFTFQLDSSRVNDAEYFLTLLGSGTEEITTKEKPRRSWLALRCSRLMRRRTRTTKLSWFVTLSFNCTKQFVGLLIYLRTVRQVNFNPF